MMTIQNQEVLNTASTVTNTRLGTALFYAEEMGWHVFPLQPQQKQPATGQGFYNATTNIEQIEKWWTENPLYNIGIATGKVSGIWVVDVDDRNGGDNSLFDLISQHGRLPDTVESITGGGSHQFFTYPSNADIPSCKLCTGIDIKSDGGYIVAPGSIHPNGKEYQFEASSDPEDGVQVANAPAWLLNMVKRDQSQLASHTINAPRNQWVDPRQISELESALHAISADEYELWIKVGLSLYSLDNDDIAFRLWDEWSQRSEKYDPAAQGKKWRSFEVRRDLNRETVFWLAQQNGWRPPEPPPTPIADIQVVKPEQEVQEKTVPDMLLDPPGILSDITYFINKTSQRPQPVFAVNAALSFCAAVIGRKVQGYTGLRTNLYLCSLGGTGGGKDHARKVLKKIAEDAGKSDLLGGENLASGQALLTRAGITPNVLFQIDEFGDFLHAIQNPNAGSHKAEVITNLMRLFSSADGVFKGTEYANQSMRDRQDIEYPCVNLHATTTPETFYPALGSRDLASGFLNRMLICESPVRLPKKNRRARITATPQSILDWISSIDVITGTNGNLQGINPAEPITIKNSDEAEQLFDQLDDFCDQQVLEQQGSGVDALWNRATEHALKISLVVAMADNATSVEKNHAEWSIAFVKHWIQYLADAVTQNVSDSPSHALEQDILRILAKRGGEGLTTRQLTQYSRKFRAAPPAMREAALKWLTSSKQIAQAEIPTSRGPARVAYVALDYFD